MEMTKGWIKYYADGSRVVGSDHNVDYEGASWRDTSLAMASVLIKDEELSGTINGVGRYWQEDDFMVPVVIDTVQRGVRVARRVMRQITEADVLFSGTNEPTSKHITFYPADVSLPPGQECYTVTPEMIGKWFVLEIDCRTRTMDHYLTTEM